MEIIKKWADYLYDLDPINGNLPDQVLRNVAVFAAGLVTGHEKGQSMSWAMPLLQKTLTAMRSRQDPQDILAPILQQLSSAVRNDLFSLAQIIRGAGYISLSDETCLLPPATPPHPGKFISKINRVSAFSLVPGKLY